MIAWDKKCPAVRIDDNAPCARWLAFRWENNRVDKVDDSLYTAGKRQLEQEKETCCCFDQLSIEIIITAFSWMKCDICSNCSSSALLHSHLSYMDIWMQLYKTCIYVLVNSRSNMPMFCPKKLISQPRGVQNPPFLIQMMLTHYTLRSVLFRPHQTPRID